MASARNEEGQILENHVITTMSVHELKVNGYLLVDKKQQTLVDPKASNGSPKMTIVIHFRSIDDRSYAVQWNHTEGKDEDQIVETEMTQEEVQRFEEDWCTLWNPLAKNLD
jgi:hypothetical protein